MGLKTQPAKSAETMEKIINGLNISLAELFNDEHMQPTKVLINDLHNIIDSIKDDSDKVKEVYKVIKGMTTV